MQQLLLELHPPSRHRCLPADVGRFAATRKFKSYVGLKGAENKLRKYLADFEFTDIATANEGIDRDIVPVVKIGLHG